jgi:hypothetical protein
MCPGQAFIKPSLARLRDWANLSASIGECQDLFLFETGLVPFDCAASFGTLVEGTTWYFSDTEHGLIKNPYLRIDELEIEDVYKPEVGEACSDLHDNDTYIPLEVDPDAPGSTKLVLASGTTSLRGPTIDGKAVVGSSGLASTATACEGKGCSSLSADLRPGNDAWRLEGLRLHSMGAATAGNAAAAVAIDEYTISLFSPVEGIQSDGNHEIAAGAAVFSLSGRTPLGDYSLTTTNTSKLMLRHTARGWTMSPFEIGYVDGNGDAWRLVIDAQQWAPRPPS